MKKDFYFTKGKQIRLQLTRFIKEITYMQNFIIDMKS